jgi:hypothetical protein
LRFSKVTLSISIRKFFYFGYSDFGIFEIWNSWKSWKMKINNIIDMYSVKYADIRLFGKCDSSFVGCKLLVASHSVLSHQTMSHMENLDFLLAKYGIWGKYWFSGLSVVKNEKLITIEKISLAFLQFCILRTFFLRLFEINLGGLFHRPFLVGFTSDVKFFHFYFPHMKYGKHWLHLQNFFLLQIIAF